MQKVCKIIVPRFEINGNRVRQIGIGLPGTSQIVTAPTTNYRYGDDGSVQAKSTWLEWIRNPIQIVPGGTGSETLTARGDWTRDMPYDPNHLVRDSFDGTFWICRVMHTSASAPTSFVQDRANHPTYWVQTPWTGSAADLMTASNMTWNNAIDNCLMTYAGIGPWSATNPCGWRLPNMKELTSIFDYSFTNNPALDPAYFIENMMVGFWTSTTAAHSTGNAWRYQYTARVFGSAAKTTYTALYAIPVRSLFAP